MIGEKSPKKKTTVTPLGPYFTVTHWEEKLVPKGGVSVKEFVVDKVVDFVDPEPGELPQSESVGSRD